MYQIMIVDDEPSVVNGLAERIDWCSLGISEVHKAFSPKEALEILTRTTIDLMITDIRMPGMNGIELVERIHAINSRTRCIILTGFSDFDYVKNAMRHNVSDYLVKPVDNEELLESLHKAIHSIQEEWNLISSYQRTLYSFRENLPAMRMVLLNDLLNGFRMPIEQLNKKLNMMDLHIEAGNPCSLLLLRMDSEFPHYNVDNVQLLQYSIGNIAEEVFRDKFSILQGRDRHDYLIFLVTLKDGQRTITDSLSEIYVRLSEELQRNIKVYLKGSVTLLASQWGTFPKDVPILYEQLLYEARRNVGNGGDYFFVAGKHTNRDVQWLKKLYEPPLLLHLLEVGRWEQAGHKLAEIFQELDQKNLHSREHLLEVYYNIHSCYAAAAHKNGKQLSDLAQDSPTLAEGIPFSNHQEVYKWALDVLQQLQEDMTKETKHNRSKVVKQVRKYIEERLSEDVSLQAIADHVNLNPGYLSRIYKIEADENLSDYLLRTRMDKACHMLRNSQDKVYQIAAQLGYGNAPYFIRVFKKQFGLTPQEYRERV
ncbi:response regulator [Paenibacillus sp. GCM10023252]|uniref:response regulator transcription factor n=1 Tax=Paenibacillus sp. GCM10023252 TaxID=3252649 RepID=UPI00361DC91C